MTRGRLAALLALAGGVVALQTPPFVRAPTPLLASRHARMAASPPPAPPAPPAPLPVIAASGPQIPMLKPSKIRRGDYVVHTRFGVGRFDGLYRAEGLTADGKALRVQFRDRWIEVRLDQRSSLKLFRRKEEVDEYSPIRLDSTRARRSWERRKTSAAKAVIKVAADLVSMYAQREDLTRPPCAPDGPRFAEFADQFEYEPTEDQKAAFKDVEGDMVHSDRPMDRLICGDVGFGKTEVAMRAAYRTICNGGQAALLAPTTVLAAQHLRLMRNRMPKVRAELLSSIARRTAAERRALLEDVEAGKVDILIGTTALLGDKVKWNRLKLLVIDEEQRFGVRQKDRIKQSSLYVDVLALSATPIPRTMYMCMAGIREMSVLASPPAGRLPVTTKVMQLDETVIARAVSEEIARGGQVFYVVPRVEMVAAELDRIHRLLPDARLVFAYGGLKDLEERIVDFTLGNADVLVATTIMENGIDIPNVNTIIIQDTHYLGLAQLHQLRGRVGRSSAQAYAYMMHPPISMLSDEALKRLRVLQREAGLGAGFNLAKSDLQIRGAGTVLGTAQKGAYGGVSGIGADMYMTILQGAMVAMRERQARGEEGQITEEELLKAVGADVDENVLFGLSDTLKQ